MAMQRDPGGKQLMRTTPHGLVATTRDGSVQTNAQATLKLPSGFALTGGVWTDFNPGYGKIGNTTRTVNETDPFFAVTVPVTSKLSLTAKYVAFIANNLPETAHNVALVASYADGKPEQAFTINPYAVFFYEVDGSSVIGIGGSAEAVIHIPAAHIVRLGMPELCRTGFSENWLVRMTHNSEVRVISMRAPGKLLICKDRASSNVGIQ